MSAKRQSDSFRSRATRAQSERVGRVLSAGMERARVTNEALYRRLCDLDPTMNANRMSTYRCGTALLPSAFAQVLAKELRLADEGSSAEVVDYFGYDPMIMIRAYGLNPDGPDDDVMRRLQPWASPPSDSDVVRRLLDLERLDAEIDEREQEFAEIERDRGAVSIVRAAIHSDKYAAAVWPVFAGRDEPGVKRLYVSDRVDLRRLDGTPVSDREVWGDLQVHLERARALPSIAMPRWSGSLSNVLDFPDPHVSMWNVRRFDAPRRPRVEHAHSGFPAIAISATVSNTWVGYLASFVSLALGYGLTSTTDLARHLHHRLGFNPSTEQRNQIHDELLAHPGERRVWYHAAKVDTSNSTSPWAPSKGSIHPGLLHVRLVEDDLLFESTAQDRLRQPGFLHTDPNAVTEWRRSRDTALKRMPSDSWHLPLVVQDAEWGSPEKWAVTLDLAIKIMDHLRVMGMRPWAGLTAVHEAHARLDPAGAGAALHWLRKQGAPFVD